MRGKRGFTLIEMVVVIAVMGFLMTILFGMTRAVVSQQRYATTRARMANIDTALAAYASTNKRLPCPADGTKPSSDSAAGLEIQNGASPRACTDGSHPNAQQHGVVPWRVLGLTSSDVEDGWGGRFTYRVGPDMVLDSGMDFTSCDPAGTFATAATTAPFCNTSCASSLMNQCTTPLLALTGAASKGVTVQNATGTVLMNPQASPSTGAAYVLISHGPEGGGAYSGEGVLVSSSVAAGTKEANNFANLQYNPASSYLVDDELNGTATNAHFDDMVSRVGILPFAIKAQTGPRAH